MAHHQERNHDRAHGTPTLQAIDNLPTTVDASSTGEEDLASEVDEPPDGPIQFKKLPTPRPQRHPSESSYFKSMPFPFDRRESLLTQGLMTSPELFPSEGPHIPSLSNLYRGMSNASNHSNASAASTADLTSDGGLTSPARTSTPSPPLPPTTYTGLSAFHADPGLPTSLVVGHEGKDQPAVQPPRVVASQRESVVETSLGRKRCITFACGRKSSPKGGDGETVASKAQDLTNDKTPQPPKRPCMLRFACPAKPSHQEEVKTEHKRSARFQSPPPPTVRVSPATPRVRTHRDSESTVTATPRSVPNSPNLTRSRKTLVLQAPDLERSEATRFHEFASSVGEEDEWVSEQTVHRHRITVNDTLKKENVIRQLGEEAEEEALQEEDEEAMEKEPGDDNDDDDDEEEDDDGLSDGGNETDDEDGFAESDEESDAGSDYLFWTPAPGTAATSTDNVEHIKPSAHRSLSESSMDSTVQRSQFLQGNLGSPHRSRKPGRSTKSAMKARPGTPDLPDSTDFVCGTLDEDRPLEAAYMSCLEERKRSKHLAIPQDIDPSFPASDPEDQDEDEVEEANEPSDEEIWIKGQLDNYDDAALRGRAKDSTPVVRTPRHSPKRLQSPPPPKRAIIHRSPPPRRLFGHSPKRMRSPPPARNMHSPPGTRHTSFAISPKHQDSGMKVTHLAQRPNLTQTKSLPRRPHPIWQEDSDVGLSAQSSACNSPRTSISPSRNTYHHEPIDIVSGLEINRQRRKEKRRRQHGRQPGKNKDRKPQPGKGAERMRELGLEMAGKGRARKESELALSL